jgi:hypothetical protein
LNVEMDGIGGIIIGNIFRLPENVLPKGYKGGDIGSKLGYTVTGIGHSLQNNDWVTKLEAQTIILDEPEGEDFDYSNITITLAVENEQVVITGGGTGGGAGSVAEDSQKYPVLVKSQAFKSIYNSTVQKYAKVSDKTPVADALRSVLDKNYIIEKGGELSSNGDITEALKSAVLTFQSKLKTTAGYEFINASKPIRITAGNDTYHRTYGEKRNRTTHCRGIAIDIGTREFTQTQINSIMALLKASGFTYVIYHGGSALHIHANLPTT